MDLSPFDPFRVPDALLAEVYEAVSPQQRAWLKTTQALVQSVYGETPTMSERRCQPAGSGFAHSIRMVPVSWTLVLVGKNFASPCRLSAALITARLAGVENVLVFFADTPDTICPAVFTACELAGVENLYALSTRSPSPENLSPFDVLLTLPPARCRVLTFGADALPLPFPAWHDTPPRIAIAPDCPLTTAHLSEFHPDACFVAPDDQIADVLYSAATDLASRGAPLCMGPGLEGAWLHLGLLPDFFQRCEMKLLQTDE